MAADDTSHALNAEPRDTQHVLAADVGGTNARLALLRIEPGGSETVAEHTAASSEAESLESILAAFLDSAGRPPLAAASLAVAVP